jgi:endonuclease/exonuclease/phosphatase (EEP) superfamily protein YafD
VADDAPSAAHAPSPGPWRRAAHTAARTTCVGAMVTAILVLLSPWWWPGECAIHWHWHVAVAAAPGAIILRRWWLAALISAVIIVAIPGLLPEATQRAPITNSGLRVTSANPGWFNHQTAATADLLLAQEADVLGVVELTIELQRELQDAYPYRVTETVGRLAFGIGLFSRYPIRDAVCLEVDWSVLINAVIDTPDGPLRVLVLHPAPPVGSSGFANRNAVLKQASQIASFATEPVLLMGDLNCSPASPAWRRLLRDAALHPSQSIARSWPAPIAATGIAIDHILTSEGLALSAITPLRLPGSDHMAISALVAPTASP